MMLKLDRDQLAAEIAGLNSLLNSLPHNDLLGRIGLEARREEVQERFNSLANEQDRRAKVALYFGGDPVVGSMGIQAGFGTSVVSTFQDLVSKVWGTAEGAQLMPMGPVKDKGGSQLHITNLVHGSFGFLLEELDRTSEPMFETPLKKAADQVVEYVVGFAGENESTFSDVIEDLNPQVLSQSDNSSGACTTLTRHSAWLKAIGMKPLTAPRSNVRGTAPNLRRSMKNMFNSRADCSVSSPCDGGSSSSPTAEHKF